MLLAAQKGKKVVVLEAPSSPSGDQVFIPAISSGTAPVKIEIFKEIKFSVKDKKVYYKDKILKTDKEEILADIEDGAKVS